jgi:SepF-like predicted cell division protein (DUF552 family)
LPSLGIFHKPKKEEDEKPEMTQPKNTETTENNEKQEESTEKTYLRAMPLHDLADLEEIKNEVKKGNILILRITPLASKNIEDVKRAVNELYEFAESIGGDIARLGEERIVICPQNVRIWREKTPVTSEPVPTAA